MGRSRSRERSERTRSERRHSEKSKKRDKEGARDRDSSRRGSSKRTRRSSSAGSIKVAEENINPNAALAAHVAKLEEKLASFMESSSKNSSNCKGAGNGFIAEKLFPEFDPSIKDQSSVKWIAKVNDCGALYDLDEKTKYCLAVGKLRGNAKVWYNELPKLGMSWTEFTQAIENKFPEDCSFGALLIEAANYRSFPGQDLPLYLTKKVGKLNKLKFPLTEEQMIDSVARGLHDEGLRTSILMAHYKTLDQLEKSLYVAQEKEVKSKGGKRGTQRDTIPDKQKSQREKKNACYQCGKPGHHRPDCPDLKQMSDDTKNEGQKTESNKNKPTCGFCHKSGHDEARCYTKNKSNKGPKKA